MLRLALIPFAVALLALVLQDAFEVMLLPRRVDRRIRLTRLYYQASWLVWVRLARHLPAGERRIRRLGVFGPLSMVGLFAVWAALLIVAFALLGWAFERRATPTLSLGGQLYLSGATFFTLGYGDVVPRSSPSRALAVLEAGTGLGFIAMVIGYLPVLYQLFARRESHVIQLDARAGSPPAAATMLVLHAELEGLAALDALLGQWESWAAELLESHLSYPMLVFYRSQYDDQSWLAAMAAIMDVCALVLVGIEDMPALQARMTFTMSRSVLVEMCRALRVSPSRFEGGDRLPHAGFERLAAALGEAGLRWKGGAEVEETLLALRATYEPLLDGLARRLELSLPPWVAAQGAAEHWQSGHRGLIARRLVEQLAAADHARAPDLGAEGRIGRRLSRRLRI